MIRFLLILSVSALLHAETAADHGQPTPPKPVAPPASTKKKTLTPPPTAKAPVEEKAAEETQAKAAAKQEQKTGKAPAAPEAAKGEAPAKAPEEAKAETPPPPPTAEAAPPPPNALDNVNLRLLEIFNAEQLPGSGSLDYKVGDKVEKIALSQESGYYALGMIFEGASLPEQYGKDFKKNQIIQIAMGSVRSKLQGQIPQFGAITLITNKIPAGKAKYPLVVPSGRESPLDEMGFLLMTGPTTPNDRSDEEKLKNTYFALSGSLTVTPRGKSRLMEVKSQGKRLNFKMRIMRVVFDAALVTPFNASPATLKGTIDFPVYQASGKEAETLTQRIATESLETTASLAGPEGLTIHNRDVAGSTKKDAKGK